MHGTNNYPLRKEQSDLDIALEDGTDDATYLYLLEQSLDSIIKRFEPDFIFYQCGVDVLATDKLGRMGLSIKGCKQRDEQVVHTARQLGIPIVCTMGGGYSPQIKHIIEAHANTFRVIQEILY
jgi:acetoin utilization deacetylase AcuC-like enzyme